MHRLKLSNRHYLCPSCAICSLLIYAYEKVFKVEWFHRFKNFHRFWILNFWIPIDESQTVGWYSDFSIWLHSFSTPFSLDYIIRTLWCTVSYKLELIEYVILSALTLAILGFDAVDIFLISKFEPHVFN